MPVTGARKPMRNSSEYAVEPRLVPTARQLPNSSGLSFRIKAFVIVLPPDVVSYFRPIRSSMHGFQLRDRFNCRPPERLPNLLRNAHQAGWQIQDRQHVDAAQHVLPPRHSVLRYSRSKSTIAEPI